MTVAHKLARRIAMLVASLVLVGTTSCGDDNSLTEPVEGLVIDSTSSTDNEFSPAALSIITSATSPNEPSTFIRFAENDLNAIPNGLGFTGTLAGNWFSWPKDDKDLTTGTSTLLPRSTSRFLSSRFPAGMQAAAAPVNFGGWDYNKREKSKVYISFWVRIRGTGYENQSAGTKFGFISYGKGPNGKANEGFLFLNGNNTQGVYSKFSFKFMQQGHVARNLYQNVNTGQLMTAGPWHRIEMLHEVNTMGQNNGKLKIWIDGIQIMSYSNVVYITPAYPYKFTQWKWNPTWGGTAGTRTRTDYIDIDHVYMSGLP